MNDDVYRKPARSDDEEPTLPSGRFVRIDFRVPLIPLWRALLALLLLSGDGA